MPNLPKHHVLRHERLRQLIEEWDAQTTGLDWENWEGGRVTPPEHLARFLDNNLPEEPSDAPR
jgi:hypothetical protein